MNQRVPSPRSTNCRASIAAFLASSVCFRESSNCLVLPTLLPIRTSPPSPAAIPTMIRTGVTIARPSTRPISNAAPAKAHARPAATSLLLRRLASRNSSIRASSQIGTGVTIARPSTRPISNAAPAKAHARPAATSLLLRRIASRNSSIRASSRSICSAGVGSASNIELSGGVAGRRDQEFAAAHRDPVTSPSLAEAPRQRLHPHLPRGRFQHRAIDDGAWRAPLLYVEHRPNVGGAVAGEALVGPAQRMRGENDVVELQDRIVGVGRLLLQNVEPGAGDAAFLQSLGQRLLVDDRAARGIDQIAGRLHQ